MRTNNETEPWCQRKTEIEVKWIGFCDRVDLGAGRGKRGKNLTYLRVLI